MAKVISLNVGLPRTVNFHGQAVTTGIFKEPVKGRIKLRKLNLDGDKQADLTVHGGLDKALYAYPAEHYDYWKERLPKMKLLWGMFGENLTTEGLLEDQVNIGDVFRIGSSEVIVTQPRMPCYKLGVKFGRMDIIRQFMDSKLTGIYFRVLKEGEIGAGDGFESSQKYHFVVRLTLLAVISFYKNTIKQSGTIYINKVKHQVWTGLQGILVVLLML